MKAFDLSTLSPFLPADFSNDRKALTLRQAAGFLGVTSPTVRKLIREGKLKAVRVSERRTYIPLDDLRSYLESASSGSRHE